MKSIRVEGLFGKFNYDIEFKQDGLTIITGPNGYGKSTILNIISNLKEDVFGLLKLMKVNFNKIYIQFNDGDNYEIVKSIDKFTINGKDVMKHVNSVLTEFGYYRQMRDEEFALLYEKYAESSHRNEKYRNYLLSELESKNLEDVVSPIRFKRITHKLKEKISFLNELSKKMGDIHFIKEQRLITSKPSHEYDSQKETVEVINEIPEKLKQIIISTATHYSQVSTQLDSSYPARLLRNQKSISEAEYKEKIHDISIKYDKLRDYDLTPKQPISEMEYKEEFSKALSVYFDDFQNKYQVYEPLIKQLDLYTEIINNRLHYKRIVITKEKGLVVLNEKGVSIPLSKLSSGEQQEIVLFYELIFGTEKCNLLLIDEPEISLHIAWQRMFTEDLIKISEMKQFKVIMATHSPHIINNRWENQIDLGELYELNQR